MTFGAEGWGTPEDEAGRIYAAYRDLGGNFVDTANEIYAGGRSEDILGRLIEGSAEHSPSIVRGPAICRRQSPLVMRNTLCPNMLSAVTGWLAAYRDSVATGVGASRLAGVIAAGLV